MHPVIIRLEPLKMVLKDVIAACMYCILNKGTSTPYTENWKTRYRDSYLYIFLYIFERVSYCPRCKDMMRQAENIRYTSELMLYYYLRTANWINLLVV